MTSLNVAVWLYGSFARGDIDELSDVDFLVIGDNRDIPDEILFNFPSSAPHRRSMSRYTWNEIEGMSVYGSLFLHHVKAEGRPIFESDSVAGKLETYLHDLPPYGHARRDVKAFREGLEESRRSLLCGGSIPFELSIIATLIRHSSILGCYFMGRPTFGRVAAVQRFVSTSGLDPKIAQEFPGLYSYKLFAENRIPQVPVQNLPFALEWCRRLDLLLAKLEVSFE
jgi:Polymerase beta, Nucleotidyltransferase